MLLLTTGTGSFVPTTLYIVCKSVVLQWDVHTTVASPYCRVRRTGFQKSSRALALSACSSRLFISTRRVESGNRGFVFLWQKLALLLEERAGVALTQDLEGRPMLGELLRDTLLGRDDGLRGLLGLLVLRAGGR